MENKQKLSIIFFGNERLATGVKDYNLPVLNSLLKHGHKIEAIFAPQNKITSRKANNLKVHEFAKNNNIAIYSNSTNQEIIDVVKKNKVNLGVLVAYGKIVPQNIIDSFKHGIINIHPSLLPKYRGSTPIESAILNGEKTTGVSLMKLVNEMDAGPIYVQKELNVEGSTKSELTEKLSTLGASLLINNLYNIVSGRLVAVDQDSSKATYCKKIKISDGLIDTNKSAQTICNEIRAYSEWPKSKLIINSRTIIILEANVAQTLNQKIFKQSVLTSLNKKLYLGCKDSVLEVTKLQLEGKNATDAQSFINGHSDMVNVVAT